MSEPISFNVWWINKYLKAKTTIFSVYKNKMDAIHGTLIQYFTYKVLIEYK